MNRPTTGWLGQLMRPLAWITAAFVPLFPAGSFFLDYAPPFFPPVGVFASFMGVGFLLWGYRREQYREKLQTRTTALTAAAVVLIVLYYSVGLTYLTVVPPHGRQGQRHQIGFYMLRWSLTERALGAVGQLPQSDPPVDVSTPDDLMMVFGAWGSPSEINTIWRPWSIVAAGLLLVFSFLVAFGLWGYAMGAWLRYLRSYSAANQSSGMSKLEILVLSTLCLAQFS